MELGLVINDLVPLNFIPEQSDLSKPKNADNGKICGNCSEIKTPVFLRVNGRNKRGDGIDFY